MVAFLQECACGRSKTFKQDVSTVLRKRSPSVILVSKDFAMILSRIHLSAGSACSGYHKLARIHEASTQVIG